MDLGRIKKAKNERVDEMASTFMSNRLHCRTLAEEGPLVSHSFEIADWAAYALDPYVKVALIGIELPFSTEGPFSLASCLG